VAAAPSNAAREDKHASNASPSRHASQHGKPVDANPAVPALPSPEFAVPAESESTAPAVAASHEHENGSPTANVTQPRSTHAAIEPPSSDVAPQPAATATPSAAAEVHAANISRAGATSVAPLPGTIPPRAIAAVIRSHADAVQDCFDRAQMDHPDLHGRIVFHATVDALGKVSRAWADNQLDNGVRLTTCILTQARDWKFPPPAGGTGGSVSYTFVFD
jgi:hypothetical protein